MIWTPGAIYGFCRKVGFRTDQWARATALALATSAGDDLFMDVSTPRGGWDRRGLFGIDAGDHPAAAGLDLFDPSDNCKAAYALTVAAGGLFDWSPVPMPTTDSAAFLAAAEAVRRGVTTQPLAAGRSAILADPANRDVLTTLAGYSDYVRSQIQPER